MNTRKRTAVLEALVEYITGLGDAIVAMDFPFSLPRGVLKSEDWEPFVRATPNEWGVLDDVSDSELLYEAVKQYTTETGCHPRRVTDENHGGQNPAGFRIKTQTYYGISAVLGPLVENESISVKPFHPSRDTEPTVVETYPAAVFGRLGAKRRGYKSDDYSGISTRRENLGVLEENGVRIDTTDRDFAVGTDDALDALAAAYGAWVEHEGIRDGSVKPPLSEGEIYAGKKQA